MAPIISPIKKSISETITTAATPQAIAPAMARGGEEAALVANEQESQNLTGDTAGLVPDESSAEVKKEAKQEPKEELGGLDYITDAVMGIPRGVAGAAMGIYDLMDIMTFDHLLPDWKDNPLGRSQTAVGGLVEGVTSFLTSFIPVAGWLGKAGKVGRLSKMALQSSKAGKKALQVSRTAIRPAGVGKTSGIQVGWVGGRVTRTLMAPKILSKAMERSLKSQDLYTRARMVYLARNAVSARIATAVSFKGNQGRLSDLIQQYPALENPISEYLATDPNFDDTKLSDRAYGRFKNVLEDMFIDGLIGVVGITGKHAIIGMSRGVAASVRATKRSQVLARQGASEAEIKKANQPDLDAVADSADDVATVNERAKTGTEGPTIDPNTHPEEGVFDPELKIWSDGEFKPIGDKKNSVHLEESKAKIPTRDELDKGLKSNQTDNIEANRALKEGTRVGLRIDIPFFRKTGKYAVTINWRTKPAAGKTKGEAKSAYDDMARLEGEVKFNASEVASEKVLLEGKAKGVFAVVEGALDPRRTVPADIDDWVPVGFDPHKAAFFYDKRTGQHVVSGVDAISIGNTVYTRKKGIKYGRRFVPQPKDRIGAARAKAGQRSKKALNTEEEAFYKAKREERVAEISARLDREAEPYTARVKQAEGQAAKGKIRREYKQMLLARLKKEAEPGGRYPGHRGIAGKMPPDGYDNAKIRKTLADVEAGVYDLTAMREGASELTSKGIQVLKRISLDMNSKYGANLYDADGHLIDGDIRRTIDSLHEEEKEFLRNFLRRPKEEGGPGFAEDMAGDMLTESEVLDQALKLAEDIPLGGAGSRGQLTAKDRVDHVMEFFKNNSVTEGMDKLIEAARRAEGDSERLLYTTHLVKVMQQVYYSEISRMAKVFSGDTSNETLGRAILASIFDLTQLRRSWRQFGSTTGKALQARQFDNADEWLRKKLMLSGDELKKKVSECETMLRAGNFTPQQIKEWKRSNSLWGKFVNATNEVFASNLISSVRTIAGVNTIGNVFSMYYYPMEAMMSHGLRAPFDPGHADLAMTAAKHFAHLHTGYMSGIRAFGRAIREGESLVVPGSSFTDERGTIGQSVMKASKRPPRSVSSAALGKEYKGEWGLDLGRWKHAEDGSWEFEANWAGSAVDWLGFMFHLPARTMGAFDDAFKTINRDAFIKANAAGDFVARMDDVKINYGRKTKPGQLTPAQQALKASGQPFERSSKDLPPGQKVTNEEVTWEVNQNVIARLVDQNGTIYTKDRVRRDAVEHLRNLRDDDGKLVHQVDSIEFGREVEKLTDEMWDPQAGAFGQAAADYALKATWQTPIPENAMIAKTIQDLLKKVPLGRLVIPFLKTPYNLLHFVMERSSPSGLAKFINAEKMAKKHMANGDLTGARPYQQYTGEYLGRMSSGIMFYGTGVLLASQGAITGSGPKDRNMRLTLLDSGWRPYSFKFGDTYISYQRLEPISTFFGIVADMVERNNHAYDNDYDEEATDTMVASVLFSLSQNLANKSYLMGLGSIFEAVQESDRYGADFGQRMVASFIPFSSALYQSKQTRAALAGEPDISYQHARSLIDHLGIKSGFLDDNISYKYNLLGKPVKRPHGGPMDIINPITYGMASSDPVRNAFAELKLTAGPPKANLFGLIDTRDEYRPGSKLSFYDFWQEETGNLKIRGRTLHESMLRIVRSSQWKSLPKSTPEGLRSPAANVLTAELHQYRKAALAKALKRYPDTNTKYQEIKFSQGQIKEQKESVPFRTLSKDVSQLLKYG